MTYFTIQVLQPEPVPELPKIKLNQIPLYKRDIQFLVNFADSTYDVTPEILRLREENIVFCK